MNKKQLLPVGFYDLLFDEAKKNHENINAALSVFMQSDYGLIKTPLVEFENGASENSFRAVDVISGKNLVFRSDITLQISRLLKTRLQKANLPLKLCYVGDVLCAKSENLYADRQQTQVGAEIIGVNDEKSDFEIISLLLSALQSLGLSNLLISFSLPDFLGIFLKEMNLPDSEELRLAIRQKNISAIRELFDEKNAEIIRNIMLVNQDLEGLMAYISLTDKIAKELGKAQKITQFLQEKFPAINVCFDLFGDEESSYHCGLVFDVFCGDFSYPVARGGRYKIDDLDAVGATIYMNRLRKIS